MVASHIIILYIGWLARPTMEQLRNCYIKKIDSSGKISHHRIVDWITSAPSSWNMDNFANKLLKNPVDVQKLPRRDGGEFVSAVLSDWLSRADGDPADMAVPRTWGNLVVCMEQAGLDRTLAKSLREIFPEGLMLIAINVLHCMVEINFRSPFRISHSYCVYQTI